MSIEKARLHCLLRFQMPVSCCPGSAGGTPILNSMDCSLLSSTLSQSLLPQILVEERRQLAEVFLCLGRVGIAGILSMRLAFEHVEIGDSAGLTQLAMHAHRIGQEQVARARCENGRRETGQIAIYR